MKRLLTRVLLPLCVVGVSVGGARIMAGSAESAERATPESAPPRVEHVQVRPESARPRLRGTGVVEPSREATISPELSGRITYLSPALVVGGRVAKDDVLLRIDKRDYQIAARQQRAQVRQAEVDLELERAYGKVAQTEWELMGNPRADGRLAARKPQGEAAAVKLDSARSALDRAKLDLGRTAIKAPFNATVTAESVEKGEIATPGQVVATLVGTDSLWVRVSVPVEYLGLIDVPGYGGTEGSPARVVQQLGDRRQVERAGTVVRLVNELDPESRTAQVLVEVERPFDVGPGELPLLPGAFVRVEFTGRPMDGVIAVPRVAVFEGRHVWVVGDEQRLQDKTLDIAWGDDEQVFVTGGIEPGDRIVVTPPPQPIEGMEVQTEAEQAATVSSVAREASTSEG